MNVISMDKNENKNNKYFCFQCKKEKKKFIKTNS